MKYDSQPLSELKRLRKEDGADTKPSYFQDVCVQQIGGSQLLSQGHQYLTFYLQNACAPENHALAECGWEDREET